MNLPYLHVSLCNLDLSKCFCFVVERLVWLGRVGIYWNRENSCLLWRRTLRHCVGKWIRLITYDLWPSIHCWKFFFDFEKIIFHISQLSWYLPFWPNKKSSKTKILINKNLLCLLEWKSHKKIVVLLKMVLKNIWSV